MRVTIWAARQTEKRHMRGLPWNTVWGPTATLRVVWLA